MMSLWCHRVKDIAQLFSQVEQTPPDLVECPFNGALPPSYRTKGSVTGCWTCWCGAYTDLFDKTGWFTLRSCRDSALAHLHTQQWGSLWVWEQYIWSSVGTKLATSISFLANTLFKLFIISARREEEEEEEGRVFVSVRLSTANLTKYWTHNLFGLISPNLRLYAEGPLVGQGDSYILMNLFYSVPDDRLIAPHSDQQLLRYRQSAFCRGSKFDI